MGKSKIEWTEYSWNPVTGCTPISEGCQNCYAKRMSKRLAGRCGYPVDEPFRVTLHPEKLGEPLKWKKPRRVFVCSMGDLFHEDVSDEFIMKVFDIMHQNPQHTFMVLTKRPERMQDLIDGMIYDGFWGPIPSHIWLGVTAENQQRADERIPILLQIPAAVRFVSVEPMLGPVDLRISAPCPDCDGAGWNGIQKSTGKRYSCETCGGDEDCLGSGIDGRINWVICGGETGPGARPMHPDWVRSLRDQCQAAGVPFFFKQWGEWGLNWLNDDNGKIEGSEWMDRFGKKKAGRILDDRTWDEMPETI